MAVSEQMFEELYQRALAATGGPKARDFDSACNLFVEWSRAMFAKHHEKENPRGVAEGWLTPKLEVENKRKYIRIAATTTGQKSRRAWAFIDKTNGNILKPDSWSTPAKGPRGSIFEPTKWKDVVGPYGVSHR
jgi:hypothetical protein